MIQIHKSAESMIQTLYFLAFHYGIILKEIITCLVNIYQLNLAILYQTRYFPFIFS